MKASIKKLWLKALRSGEYKQGRGGLKKIDLEGNERFCCLGVLCDLHAKAHDLKWTKSRQSTYGSYFRNTGHLPKAVREWSGIPDDSGRIFNQNGTLKTSLAELNDRKNSNFEEVALAIEKHF